MKAEHRKELETNALAEGMGRMIRNIKEKPKNRSIFVWIGAILLALVANEFLAYFVGFWPIPGYFGSVAKQTNSELWAKMDLATDMGTIYQMGFESDGPGRERVQPIETDQGKLARFQVAWFYLYDNGIRTLVSGPKEAIDAVETSKLHFGRLADECEKDLILGPEALYAIAVAEETLAADPGKTEKQLQAAIAAYRKVRTQFPVSALGIEAEKRAKVLDSDVEGPRITNYYKDLSVEVERQRDMLKLFKGHPQFNQK